MDEAFFEGRMMMIDIELDVETLESAAESLCVLAQRMRYDVRILKNAAITLFEMLRHLDPNALEEALDEMDLAPGAFFVEINEAKAVIGWDDDDVCVD